MVRDGVVRSIWAFHYQVDVQETVSLECENQHPERVYAENEEVLATFGGMTAPSRGALRARLGKWIPFKVEFPSRARKQAVSSNFASFSEVHRVADGVKTHMAGWT